MITGVINYDFIKIEPTNTQKNVQNDGHADTFQFKRFNIVSSQCFQINTHSVKNID